MTAQSKTIINRSPALVPCICMAFPSACPADPEAEFSRKFSEGFEPAVLLEDHGSDDGAVSLIFSARKTGLAAASWPSIIADVSINGTTVVTENCVAENWIVSLGDKRRLGVIKSAHPAFRPYYPGQNHNELSALWGPEQEGWHYGVLCYTGRWECSDIFFVNHDGETAVATSMRAMLDSASSSAISAKSGDPARYRWGQVSHFNISGVACWFTAPAWRAIPRR